MNIKRNFKGAGPTITNKTNQAAKVSPLSETLDNQWLKNTFILKASEVPGGSPYLDYIHSNRYFNTADLKFTATSAGTNMALNPKPQYTRYCDPRRKGKVSERPTISLHTTGHPSGLGMGGYYSEAHDDSEQRVFFRFGVPKYMSLLVWLFRAFDVEKAVLMNRGIITSTMLKAIGLVSKFFAITASIPLAIGMYLINGFVLNSRFYSVKDTMYVYWNMVETIMNAMVARRSMMPNYYYHISAKGDRSIGRVQDVSSQYYEQLHRLMPDIIDAETGRISIWAVALRAQTIYNRAYAADMKKNATKPARFDFTGKSLNFEGGDKMPGSFGSPSRNNNITDKDGNMSLFTKYLFSFAYNKLVSNNADTAINTGKDAKSVTTIDLIQMDELTTDKKGAGVKIPEGASDTNIDKLLYDNYNSKKSTFNKYKEYLMSELSEGAAFAVFNVDTTGSVSESFSNSFATNPIEATFNSMASKARNITNIISGAGDIAYVGEILKFAADAASVIASNATYGAINPLLALAYGVNITMPKAWEDSSASLSEASYKLRLQSPYNNAFSQLFNIYLPLACLLAGSLPRSTGSASYASPFYCQVFDRGRVSIQLGMIRSIQITRGVSNLAFNRSGNSNAIDVDLSVYNLDEVVALDVTNNSVISKGFGAISPDFSNTPLTAYLDSVMGVDVYSQVYTIPRIRLRLAERYMAAKAAFIQPDPAAYAAFTAEMVPFTSLAKLIIGNNARLVQDAAN